MEYVSEEEYAQLRAASEENTARGRIIGAARYDPTSDAVVLTFPNGNGLSIPIAHIEELAHANKQSLPSLRLSVSGEALTLEEADAHISARGLIRDFVAALPGEILSAEFA